jgi:protein disulfide-isomerase
MANSFNAHRLLHLAKKYNKSNELEELLFKAYLTDGKNINDFVKRPRIKAGLEKDEIETVLHSDAYGEPLKRYRNGAECRSSRSSFLRLRQ